MTAYILINRRGVIIEGCYHEREAIRLRERYYRKGIKGLRVKAIDELPEKLR